MTYAAMTQDHVFSRRRGSQSTRPLLAASCLLVLVLGASAGALRLDADRPVAAASPTPEPTPIARAIPAAPYTGLFDPALAQAAAAEPFGGTSPLGSTWQEPRIASTADAVSVDDETVAAADEVPVPAAATPTTPEWSAPLPLPRPREVDASGARLAPRSMGRPPQRLATAGAPEAPVDGRNFIERLLGIPQSLKTVLAYASPEDGAVGPMRGALPPSMLSADRSTAVYDISAHTVTLPTGVVLEAHSGLGDRLDDPRHVNEPNRGATPPHIYDLELRTQLFHGVQALRLTPVGGGGVYGRTGLLAHTFMLGPNGDSNGCVSFRNYEAFLQAYLRGTVRRLVVVAGR